MIRSTSLESYDILKPTLGDRQKMVLETIRILGCPTNLELSKYLNIPINQITPRTNELVKMGKVTECEKRECSVSHKKVYSWRVKE